VGSRSGEQPLRRQRHGQLPTVRCVRAPACLCICRSSRRCNTTWPRYPKRTTTCCGERRRGHPCCACVRLCGPAQPQPLACCRALARTAPCNAPRSPLQGIRGQAHGVRDSSRRAGLPTTGHKHQYGAGGLGRGRITTAPRSSRGGGGRAVSYRRPSGCAPIRTAAIGRPNAVCGCLEGSQLRRRAAPRRGASSWRARMWRVL
jgi:hypothetical protein